MAEEFVIRDMALADQAAWRRLWADYIAFYGAQVAADVTDTTWARLLATERPLIGRVAVTPNGAVVGFSISLLHAGTWSLNPYCYLEDLFVAPVARRKGVGQALIEDLIALGRAQGWSRLYWMTTADNTAARRLYDRFARADGYVRYRIGL